MTRLFVLVGFLAVVGVAAVAYLRARSRDERRGGDGLPALPEHLRAAPTTWVIFTTPYCASCSVVEGQLRTAFPDDGVVKIDATVEVDLASRYGVRRAPTVLRTDAAGAVVDRLVGAEAVARLVPA